MEKPSKYQNKGVTHASTNQSSRSPCPANSGNFLLARQYSRGRIYLSKSSPVLRSRSKYLGGHRASSQTEGRGRYDTVVHPNSRSCHFAHLSLDRVSHERFVIF